MKTTPKATAVPPGYGAPSDPSLFDAMRVYLDDFVSAVDGEPTDVAALERMSASIRGSNKR
ncbi:MAG: hypothetical protein ABSB97_07790, partial [Thermoplasmata archaeon]